MPSWSLKSSRADTQKSIKIIDEQNVVDGVGMLLRASRLVHPSPSCCQPNSSHLQPCAKACHWKIEIVSKLNMPHTRAALTHRHAEVGYRRPAPLPQGRMNFVVRFLLQSTQWAEATTCHLNYIFAQAFHVLSYFLHPPLQVSPDNTPLVSQSVAQKSLGFASGEHDLKYKVIPGSD